VKYPIRPKILDKVFDPPSYEDGVRCPLCKGHHTITKGNGARDICPVCLGRGKMVLETKELYFKWVEDQKKGLEIDKDYARRMYEKEVAEYNRKKEVIDKAIDKLTSEELALLTEFLEEERGDYDSSDDRYFDW
jgi:hypothetical protein